MRNLLAREDHNIATKNQNKRTINPLSNGASLSEESLIKKPTMPIVKKIILTALVGERNCLTDFLKEYCDVMYLSRTDNISSTQLKNTLKTFSVSKDELIKAFEVLEQLKKDFE